MAPDWLPFVKRYVTLARTSNDSNKPATTVRLGEDGRDINSGANAAITTLGQLTIHFDIPSDWNDVQVAQYMLTQIADDIDVHRLAASWAIDNPKLLQQIRDQRFKNGLPIIAALARTYYTAIASLLPGGQAAVAAWDIQKGDKLGAALDVAFMLPLSKIAKTGVEATGAVAIHVGDKLIGVLPVQALERIGKLAPEQKALLHARLQAATTGEKKRTFWFSKKSRMSPFSFFHSPVAFPSQSSPSRRYRSTRSRPGRPAGGDRGAGGTRNMCCFYGASIDVAAVASPARPD